MKFIHGLKQPLQLIGSSWGTGPAKLISFFFSEMGTPSERSFLGLLHCLLSQLLVAIPESIPIIQDRYQRLFLRSGSESQRSTIWTEAELQGAFDDIIRAQQSNASFFCIVDGLDECEESKTHETLGFLRKLAELPGTGLLRFKVLCSSRPDNAVEMGLSKYSFFRIQDYTSNDIQKFVREKFAATTENLYPGDPVLEIVDDLAPEIVEKAEGVFIWARLVVTEILFAIESGDAISQEGFSGELPSDLEELYNRILSKIPKQYLHQTVNYLRIIRKCLCRNLLGMTVAVQAPNEPLLRPLPMPPVADQSKISKCITMKRLIQSRCRGLVTVPTLNPKWTFEQNSKEIMASFCMGELSIHRTVHEFLFDKGRLDKLCAQIDAALLDDERAQKIAFHFRLWHYDPMFQAQVYNYKNPKEYEAERGAPMFTGIFQSLLSELQSSECPPSTSPLSVTWLPLINSHLKQTFPTTDSYEEYLDDAVKHDYISLERFAEDPAMSRWHTNILCIAVKYHLYSYVRANLHRDNITKPGRPLLHYALCRWGCHPIDKVKLLLSRGCRTDTEFNFRTTWEFLLIASSTVYDLGAGDGKLAEVIPMFLKHGADANQQLDLHDYQCFALHVLFTNDHLDYKILEPILQEMLARGANVNVRDSRGRSVIDLAREIRPEAVSLLQSSSSTSQPPPVLNNTNTMCKKIAAANRESDVSGNLLLALEEQEGYYEEFLERRPFRITNDHWAMQSNMSASGANAAIQISNESSDNGGVAAPPDADEKVGNNEGLREHDALVTTAQMLTAQVGGCRISEIA